MSVSSSSQRRQRQREQRVRDVVLHVAEARAGGEPLTDDEVLAEHADLAPEWPVSRTGVLKWIKLTAFFYTCSRC